MSDRTDVFRLFAEYASGKIADDELNILEEALRADANLRQDFIEYMNVDSALGDLAALSGAEMAELETVQPDCVAPARPGGNARQRVRVVALGGAIVVTLLVVASLWIARATPEPVAKLVAGIDAVLNTSEQEVWSSTELPAGAYTLERGLIHLRFRGGVMVYLEAPTRFDALSDGRIVLHEGRLSASVPPEGIGFTVETPEAEVVDFGTEFSIEAESGASEVHVFDGVVRVHSRRGKRSETKAIDLRASEAIRIEDSQQGPVAIKLATERFIRNFVEPKRRYPRSVKQLSPVAYYRMPIRDRGLVSEPPQYSGLVLTGEGIRPPHARGVFAGGSLRVRADSTGRGGRVDAPPPLGTGQFTLAAFIYLESQTPGGTVAANIRGAEGNFELALDDKGRLQATIRNSDGDLRSVTSDALLPLTTWRHLVMTADGSQLKIYEDGQLVTKTPCMKMAASESEAVWFGTRADGLGLWNGRIDELALFDRALSERDVGDLYQAALEEIARSQ